MRIFVHELRKLWSGRTVLLLSALALLSFFAFAQSSIDSYNAFLTTGIYGPYQSEMFERYGDTLEADELADFDIEGRRAEARSEVDRIIASEPIFAQYGIANLADYETLQGRWDELSVSEQDYTKMHEVLFGYGAPGVVILGDTELSNLPYLRLQMLDKLDRRYTHPNDTANTMAEFDNRPVVRRQAQRFAEYSQNLVAFQLTPSFSAHAAVTVLFITTAVLLLAAPLLTIDRMRKIHLLQYTARAGRRVLATQLAAVLLSALALSLFLVVASWASFFASTGCLAYWDAHLADIGYGFFMYNISFGTYALLLAGMSIALGVATAGVAFVLSRFSDSLVSLFLKAVPTAVGMAAIGILACNWALAYDNFIFSEVFRGMLDWPEVITCAVLGIVAPLLTLPLVVRERHLDIN